MINTLTLEQKEQAQRLFKWCVENNNENFSVFCEFFGHTDTMSLHYHKDGWKEGKTAKYILCSDIIPTKNKTTEIIENLEYELQESIKRNSPEFIKENAERTKNERIIKLKKELKELEGKEIKQKSTD